jgi:hypothetical protein
MPESKLDTVVRLAQELGSKRPDFFAILGPGKGDRATVEFVRELRTAAKRALGCDYAEHGILGASAVAVDYWFPDEQAVLEIAFGLRNPQSEFERDVLKVVIARANGVPVSRLLLLSKPGAAKRLSAPWYCQVVSWAASQGLTVELLELAKSSNFVD